MSLNREKIDKFVGMLGVDSDGEKANAARFLHKFALENKMTMVEMFSKVYGGGGERIVYVEKIVEKPVYRDRPGPSGTAGPPPRQDFDPRKTNMHGTAQRQQGSKAYGYGSILGKLSALLAHHSHKLDDWEKDFVDNIRPKVAEGLDLTPKQRISLNKIFDKVGM
jgi:hypothetical protein